MIELRTISRRKEFKYGGSIKEGTTIIFGENRRVFVSYEEWNCLLHTFDKKTVLIGTSRTSPSKDSLGFWLKENITKQAIASYVAPILIEEGLAELKGKHSIKFINN